MRTILAFDIVDRKSATAALCDPDDQVHLALMNIAARLTTNVFYPKLDRDEPEKIIIEQFCSHIKLIPVPPSDSSLDGMQSTPDRTAVADSHGIDHRSQPSPFLFVDAKYEAHDEASKPATGDWCPDPDLNAYGVTISLDDKVRCRIPLRTGNKPTGILTCTLESSFAEQVRAAMKAAEVYRGIPEAFPKGGRGEGEPATWRKLRRGLGDLIGAWARMVAPILAEHQTAPSSEGHAPIED